MTRSVWLRVARSSWIPRRSFRQTTKNPSIEQSKDQTSSVSTSAKEEERDDEDPPFALLSRRTWRLLKIIVTTAAGVTCVLADYSEITEEHIFSGLQRKVKKAWKETWSIDSQKRLELENKRKRLQEASSSSGTPTDTVAES